MFGFNSRSKSTATVLSVAVLASAILAPAAMAHGHSGGNAFQIPDTTAFAMYQAQQSPVLPTVHAIRRTPLPTVVQRSTTNPNCAGGVDEMDRSEAGNGMGLVMTCR